MESGITFYLWLLLAAAAGWFLARLAPGSNSRSRRTTSDIFQNYFVGLNYLLRDEPDEAIDTFIKGLEVNGDTIETHLALGALLRRRGKVDRAITVHQDLLARSGLSSEFGDSVRLELSNDYIAAGLLDRAERLLKEMLADNNPARWDALSQLVTVYQTEKEWGQAIEVVEQLIQNSRYRKDRNLRSIAAHYCCELADQALIKGDLAETRDHLRRAFQFDRNSARACLLLAEVERRSGSLSSARKELLRLAGSHPYLITEVLEPLAECLAEAGNEPGAELRKNLVKLLDEHPGAALLLEVVRLTREQEGDEPALQTLADGLRKHPSLKASLALLQWHLPLVPQEQGDNLKLCAQTLENFLEARPGYRCEHCGFETRRLYWQCPSCQKWDRLNPIRGADGD